MPPAAIERLLALHAECARAGEYEAAYHALMAAVHLSDHAADVQSLALVADAADALDDNIEAAVPAHQLSREKAAQRGQQSLCESLRVHIEAVRLRLRSVQQRRRSAPA